MITEHRTRRAAWELFKDHVSYNCFCMKLRKCHSFRAIGFGTAEILPSGKIITLTRPRLN